MMHLFVFQLNYVWKNAMNPNAANVITRPTFLKYQLDDCDGLTSGSGRTRETAVRRSRFVPSGGQD